MYKSILLIMGLIGCCSILCTASDFQRKMVNCNYNASSILRSGDDNFEPSDIDPHLCTHLTYQITFDLTPTGEFKVLNGLLHFDVDLRKGLISRTMDLKVINPKLKVLAGVHFEKLGEEVYSEMAVNVTKRYLFVETVSTLVLKNGFDGLDLNWQFPNRNESSSLNKTYAITILKDLKELFNIFKFELSISVGAAIATDPISYDIPSIVEQVDFINVMAFNFAEGEHKKLFYNAPLMGQGERNVLSLIDYWKRQGAPTSKLVLGLASFGANVELTDPEKFEVGSPINSTQSSIGYNTICLLEKTWTYKWDNKYFIPLLHNDNQFISYDNARSMRAKCDLLSYGGLAGFMVSTIDNDDFRGLCDEKYPLLRAINDSFKREKIIGGFQEKPHANAYVSDD